MKHIVAAAALAVVALATVALSARSEAFVPLFLWSGRPLFANDHLSVSDTVSGSEFRHIFQRIVGGAHSHKHSKYLNTPVYYESSHEAPEVVVAFVYNHLSSAAASREAGAYGPVENANFQYLRSAMAAAASSFAAPSLLATTPIGAEIADLHSAIAPNAQVFATQIDGDSAEAVNTCDALLQSVEEHSYVFANKQTDLIVVKYSDAVASRADHCMQRVADAVAARTAGNFLAVASAEMAEPLQFAFVESQAHANTLLSGVNYAQRFKAQANGVGATYGGRNGTLPGVKMITPSIFWALIIALVMVIAITCGVCWVQSVETPARFTSTPLILAKEY